MKFSALFPAWIMIFAVGCSAPQSADPAAQASSPAATSASPAPMPPFTTSQFAARWMGLTPNQPQGWEELNRQITGDYQQFSLRPTDEAESRYGCNGCAPSTVDLTAYAPGKFDPTEARAGKPVTVNADGDGFLVEDESKRAATLTWQYAADAWATVRGMTSATTEFDRMVELAHALQPTERTPIRLPLSLPNLPANMPLAEINVDQRGYGTTLDFAPCGSPVNGGAGNCVQEAETLNVHIWPVDGYRGYFEEEAALPVKIGVKDGLFDDAVNGVGDHAAVQAAPGMLVVFDCGVPGPRDPGSPPEPPTSLKNILASVGWAPEPGDPATWPAVSDWAK